ncbi:hypothetical protein ARALYDRAFT_915965 [Arabidopsis lyrata subsp. lyrata]|uniref:RRM domain-containing protein n=1 Tax=Arabidopsis lyrata subsp. lyrata TaxID=81972 RepID=D7MIL0_ARALL|nr:hypothetical protein ARALYDRAFT_915965 [Arabidopsis lyrata subsp. lyrata]
MMFCVDITDCGGVEVSSRVERNSCITDEKWLCRAVTSELKKTTGDFAEGAWAGAAHYLLWYMLASHLLKSNCSAKGDDSKFNFGIYGQAISSKKFSKFCYCIWWSFQNLRSRAANKYISRRGFVFQRVRSRVSSFALLLGNMQTYLHLLTVRLEEMRIKRCDSEQYHRSLPQNLRERVRRYDQYKWLETRGVKEENLVQSLATDLRRDIKRHLCLSLVRRNHVFIYEVSHLVIGVCIDEFKEFFMQFGELKEHQIMRDHSTGRSRGFGFVTYEK